MAPAYISSVSSLQERLQLGIKQVGAFSSPSSSTTQHACMCMRVRGACRPSDGAICTSTSHTTTRQLVPLYQPPFSRSYAPPMCTNIRFRTWKKNQFEIGRTGLRIVISDAGLGTVHIYAAYTAPATLRMHEAAPPAASPAGDLSRTSRPSKRHAGAQVQDLAAHGSSSAR